MFKLNVRRSLLVSLAALPLVVASTANAQPAAAPAPAAAKAPENLKIAIIDTRRAVLETEEGLRVTATLKKLFDSRQIELSNKEKQLQQEGEDLAKQERERGSNKDLENKKDALRANIAKLQQTLMEYQRDMQRKEQELTNPMLSKVMGLVKRIATQDGFDVVVDKGVVPYFRGDLDLTDRVIQMYNAEGPKDGGKKGAKPAPAPKQPAPKK